MMVVMVVVVMMPEADAGHADDDPVVVMMMMVMPPPRPPAGMVMVVIPRHLHVALLAIDRLILGCRHMAARNAARAFGIGSSNSAYERTFIGSGVCVAGVACAP